MKNILYILLLTTQFFFAQKGFEKGNALYQKGNYKEAISEYERVLKTDKKESAELYYNLGNSYYKLNKVAPSIYYYEKALVLSPNNSEVENNLKFAHKLRIDEIKELPKVGFEKLTRDFTGIYHFNTWAIISVAFSILFLMVFLGYYFIQASLYKRIFFIGMFVIIFLLLISISSAFFEKSHFENERPAIVFAELTEFKSEPQNTSSPILILHEGTKVYVEETLGKWEKVRLTDDTEGWIINTAIKEVKKF